MYGGLKPLSIKFIETIFEKKGFKNIGGRCKFSPISLTTSDKSDSGPSGLPRGRTGVFQFATKGKEEGARLLPGWDHVCRDRGDPIPKRLAWLPVQVVHRDHADHQRQQGSGSDALGPSQQFGPAVHYL